MKKLSLLSFCVGAFLILFVYSPVSGQNNEEVSGDPTAETQYGMAEEPTPEGLETQNTLSPEADPTNPNFSQDSKSGNIKFRMPKRLPVDITENAENVRAADSDQKFEFIFEGNNPAFNDALDSPSEFSGDKFSGLSVEHSYDPTSNATVVTISNKEGSNLSKIEIEDRLNQLKNSSTKTN